MSSVDKRIILVTGANKGLGYEVVKQLSQRFPHGTIFLGTRSLDNGQKAIARMQDEKSAKVDNVKSIELDVTDKQSIARAAQVVKAAHGHLDVLVCNAGVSGLNGESAETVLSVNVDGVRDTIEAFLPVLTPTGLITVVASEVGAWAMDALPAKLQETLSAPQDITWSRIQQLRADWLAYKKEQKHEEPWPPVTLVVDTYGVSKALLLAWTRWFALQQPQRKVVIVCPGYCATDLNKHTGPRSAAVGGESIIWPILHAEAESGKFYQDGKQLNFLVAAPEWVRNAKELKKH